MTDGERVIVFFGDYGVLAYDLSGRELWKKELGPFDNVTERSFTDSGWRSRDSRRRPANGLLPNGTRRNLWRGGLEEGASEAKSGHSTPITYRA